MTGFADPRDCPYVGLDPFEKAYERFYFGREQDSRVIADHVASRLITVLYGPSGVGKSSILNVGLPAALRRRGKWTIVTLRDWQDPNAIEQRAVEALRTALPGGMKNSQRHTRFPRQVVGALHATGQPLLLILDQFEEYFLYRDESLLDAEKALGALIASRRLDIHVLIALRDDSLHFLDRLRAIVPGILETTIRLGHLNDIAAQKAIRGPVEQYNEIYREGAAPIEVEDSLVDTLIRDLRQGGGRQIGESGGPWTSGPIELPYLQLTLTKLWAAEGGRDATALRAETLTKKLGGVQQIARVHVDRILSGLTEREQALCADIFRNLVTSSGNKIAYPTNDLARQITDDRRQASEGHANETVAAEDVKAVLQRLTPTETRLLKPVKTNGVDAFELFHDVLGQPVLRWRQEFKANARLRAEQRRGRVLQRRGRVLLGVATVFGLITLLALFATGYAYMQTVEARETLGRSIWSALELQQSELNSSDIDGLWQVTLLDGDQRDGFLAPLEYFNRGPAAQFVAWAGTVLRPMRLEPLDNAQPDEALEKRFARRPVAVLRALGLRPLTNDQAQAAVGLILTAIERSTEPDDLRNLARALQAMPVKLTDQQAQAVVGPIIAAIQQQTADLSSLEQVWGILEGLPAKLVDGQSQEDLSPFLDLIKSNGSDEIKALAQALQAVPAKLTDAQAQAVIAPLLAAMNPTANPFALLVLAQGLQAMPVKVAGTQAQASVDLIVTTIKQTTNPIAVWLLALALQAMPADLTNVQTQAAIEPILIAIKESSSPIALQLSAQALQALAPKLTEVQGQVAVDPVLAAIKKTTNPYALRSLALALYALPGKLSDVRAQAAVVRTVEVIKQTIDPASLQALSGVLPASLADAQAEAAISPLLKAMKGTSLPTALQAQADALQALAPKLTEAQAQAAIDPVLIAMEQLNYPPAIRSLAKALQAIPGKLTDAQAQAALDPILELIKHQTGSSGSTGQMLGEALQALAVKLTDAQAQAALDPIVAVIKQTAANPYVVSPLAQALQARSPANLRTRRCLDCAAASTWISTISPTRRVIRPRKPGPASSPS